MKTTVCFVLSGLALGLGSAGAQAPAGAAGSAGSQVLRGGFQVGDRILLQVERDSQFTGTFAVGPGPALRLPVIGDIPLVGVPRSEAEAYLRQQLGRYLKDPVVHARALIRLSILGEVERPGFYSVSADASLGDAVMQAGGPTRESKVSDLHIERDGKAILARDSLQLALTRGLTVDQLDLRDGDRLVVPRMIRDSDKKWRVIGILLTLPAAIYGITRVF
jgi:protein involved in polysaccharide export with SLBB domain